MTDSTLETSPYRAYRWAVLAAASGGMFLGTLDITVNVALPDITRDFATDLSSVQWIIVFYVGSTTGLQLALGNAADIYGLKRFYVVGLAAYTLAVLLIGLAPSLPLVFGLRVLQAVGNGLILASAPALVTRASPPERRGRALGLLVGLATAGMVVGSVLGGVLVDAYGWRSIFLGRVPLGLLVAALTLLAIKDPPRGDREASFDYSGAVSLFVALASGVLLLVLGGRDGWSSPAVFVLAALAAGAGVVFVFVERSASRPVLELALLRHRVITPLMVSGFLMWFAIFVNLFILPFYVSDVLHASAKTLGLLLMLTPLAIGLASPVGGWLSDRVQPAYLTTVGLVVAAASMYWLSGLDGHSTAAQVAARLVLLGVGAGVFQASNASLLMGGVSATRLGTGGSLIALSRSLGVVTSVAVLSAFFDARLDAHSSGGGPLSEAFVAAFQETYRISVALAVAAAAVSLIYWPSPRRR